MTKIYSKNNSFKTALNNAKPSVEAEFGGRAKLYELQLYAM
jgi:hypothetical protein